jgi:cytochrome d ubiquinol oxidase subunit II
MVSSTDFANSLTVDSAASSSYALKVMSVAALVLTPLVLLYQGWTYYVFRHRVEGEPTILDEPDAGEPGPEPEPAH